MESATCGNVLHFGAWRADRSAGELSGPDGVIRVEPKVMDLLFLLAAHPGEVLGRETLLATLWPGVVVGDDSLARTVSKLRTALGDDAKAPRYIETIAKRGYRWLPPVEQTHQGVASPPAALGSPQRSWRTAGIVAVAALLVTVALLVVLQRERAPDVAPSEGDDQTSVSIALLARADDAYFQFSRAENEAAIALYERVLGLTPEDPAALAGLANALVQRALRWPQDSGTDISEFRRLGDALANGHLQREPQRAQVQRARLLAERAVDRAPQSSAAHKALGFVAGAQGRFDDAMAAYEQSVALDPDAWGALINIGDVLEIRGRPTEAVIWFERAYAAMERVYAHNPAQVRPWQAALGVLIAARLQEDGDRAAAESWYRRVLQHAPFDAGATSGLARLLREGGDAPQAERICAELLQRTAVDCE